MDTARQALKGRSEKIEKGIDTAVERLGRYNERLSQSAEGWKAKVRELDEERSDRSDTGTTGTRPEPLIAPDIEPTGPADPTSDHVAPSPPEAEDPIVPPDEGGPYPAV